MLSVLDDDTIDFTVIVNDEKQHSLWPFHVAVPAGWAVSFGPATRDICLDHTREHWSDMRPASIRAFYRDGRVEGSEA